MSKAVFSHYSTLLLKYLFLLSGSGPGGATLEVKQENGLLNPKKGLERGEILELAGGRSAEGKSGCRSLERQGQKGSERF